MVVMENVGFREPGLSLVFPSFTLAYKRHLAKYKARLS